MEDGTLIISENFHAAYWGDGVHRLQVVIEVPEQLELEELSVEVGAGNIDIKEGLLTTAYASLDVDAGNLDFVGEVTILAGMEKTSVTIEALTETTVIYFSRKDFEHWIEEDIHFLRLVSHKIAYKLYRSSYNRGARLFYPPNFILLDYVLKQAAQLGIGKKKEITIPKTRQEMYEECGITVKTLNRTISKLKEDGLISIKKGKISMNLAQYELAKEKIHHYVNY